MFADKNSCDPKRRGPDRSVLRATSSDVPNNPASRIAAGLHAVVVMVLTLPPVEATTWLHIYALVGRPRTPGFAA
jgi:hypothetical protein